MIGGAAVLVGVMQLYSWAALSVVPGAWSVSCADWQSFVLIVGVPCLMCSLAVPGVWSFLRLTQPRGLQCTKKGMNKTTPLYREGSAHASVGCVIVTQRSV